MNWADQVAEVERSRARLRAQRAYECGRGPKPVADLVAGRPRAKWWIQATRWLTHWYRRLVVARAERRLYDAMRPDDRHKPPHS